MSTPPLDEHLPNLSVHIKSELQYDVDQHSAGSVSALAMTASSRGQGFLNAYCINNGKVYHAYRDAFSEATDSPSWSVEDMRFRGNLRLNSSSMVSSDLLCYSLEESRPSFRLLYS